MSLTLGKDNRFAACSCLACGKVLDAANVVSTDGQDYAPSSGDITICLGCGHVMAFDDDLKLREMTDAEAREIAGDRRMLAVQKARGELERGVCTCQWSPVNTATVDPPHIVRIDPCCPRHGHEVDEWEPNESGFSVHPVRRRENDDPD